MSDRHEDVLSVKDGCLCVSYDDGEDESFKEVAVKEGFSEEQADFMEKIVKLILF